MEIRVMVRRIGNSLHILIPREVSRALNLKARDMMWMDVKDGAIVIRKKK